jgi:hypothetical protein
MEDILLWLIVISVCIVMVSLIGHFTIALVISMLTMCTLFLIGVISYD